MARGLDPITGLYCVRNRRYDPVAARFVSEYPIGLEGGINPYAYAGNSPTNLRDPTGLSPEGGNDQCAKLAEQIEDARAREVFLNACRLMTGRTIALQPLVATAPGGVLNRLMNTTDAILAGLPTRAVDLTPAGVDQLRMRAYSIRSSALYRGCKINHIRFTDWGVTLMRSGGAFRVSIRIDRATWSVTRSPLPSGVVERHQLYVGNWGYYRGQLAGYGPHDLVLPAEAIVDCDEGVGHFFADTDLAR